MRWLDIAAGAAISRRHCPHVGHITGIGPFPGSDGRLYVHCHPNLDFINGDFKKPKK